MNNAIIYRNRTEAFGEAMTGTRDEFREELATLWPVWYREACAIHEFLHGEPLGTTIYEYIDLMLNRELVPV